MQADFGKTAEDYARHRAGFPESLFVRLAAFGVGKREQTIVDLGTGTGTLARAFARMGCRVIGIDPSQAMIDAARSLDRAADVNVDYRVGVAEATELASSSADAVSAGQCWHWFDRAVAAREVRRILKPGGGLVICHLDWLPLSDNVAERTERLIIAHNPKWDGAGGCGVNSQWLRYVDSAGYRDIESFSYEVPVMYTHESWRGRIRASAGVSASLPLEEVELFDEELRAMLTDRFPGSDLQVPHRIFVVVARAPG